MAPIPAELLYGVYLGLLTGIIPALIAWVLGFVVRYVTGITLPGFAVVGLGMALAGINGGVLALANPEYTAAGGIPVVVAIIVVLMMALYAHAKGDAMAVTFPRRMSLGRLRERTLSAEVVDLVGGRSEVTVRVTGVTDIEGYPPLAPELRERLRVERPFPADLPLEELERRLADTLRSEFDLAEALVTIDERGRADVAAAPPLSGVSKRVPRGKRAVSVDAVLPTGLARGDEVRVILDGDTVTGTVLSARSAGAPAPATDGGAPVEEGVAEPAPAAPVTDGGEGRITVAVDRDEAEPLLAAERGRVVVSARGTNAEYELVSLLRRAGRRVRRVTAGETPLDGATLGEANVRETFGVAVLAVRDGGRWRVAPRGDTRLESGDELFVAGSNDALDRFAEAIA